jgi:hypothetical protein
MSTPLPDPWSDHLVGVLGGTRVATVDRFGSVRPERALWSLDWWIGGDDRWHLPDREPAVRQSLVEGMPLVRTSMRVPGGDAIHQVYGVTGDAVVVDVENASPAPFVVAFVLRGVSGIALDDTTVLVDGIPAVTAVRPPSRWAIGGERPLVEIVTTGNAHDGPMPPRRDRGGRLDVAFLYPVAHRTRLRVAVALGRRDSPGVVGLDLTGLPDGESVVRGWQAQLDRGMRVEVPDVALQTEIDSARAQVLLAGKAGRPLPEVVAALEDWGFDAEAEAAWHGLGVFAKRRAARRDAGVAPSSGSAPSGVAVAARRLLEVRRQLVDEQARTIQLFPQWPLAWDGQAVDVRDAPTRVGPVSCSVRWHGDRPALLWEVPPGAQVCAPGLDATWASSDVRGETLLAARG